MAHINLLPWREEVRKQRNTEFGIMGGVVLVVALAILGAVHLYHSALINHQQQRNDLLDQEISLLDKKIKEIKELEQEKEKLLARMNVIQRLQSSRPMIVHLFEELVSTLPEGVNLRGVQQTGSAVSVDGVAQSNARVSSFMRNIESSEFLEAAKLTVIRTNQKQGQRISEFSLKMKQKSLGPEDEMDEEI